MDDTAGTISVPRLLLPRLEALKNRKPRKVRVEILDSLAVMAWLICGTTRKSDGYAPWNEREYANLSKVFFARYVNARQISRLKKLLREWTIIEEDGEYSYHSAWRPRKSLGYRITDDAMRSGWGEYSVCPIRTKPRLEKNRGLVSSQKLSLPVHGQLRDSLKYLEIDVRQAHQIIDTLEGEGAQLFARAAVEKIAAGLFRIAVDKHGRVHTNVTNLPGRLRTTLTLNGLSLAELDIRCSQPTLLAASIPEDLYQYRDVQQYAALCQAGELYHYLMNSIDFDDRGQCKRELFHFFYAPTPRGTRTPKFENREEEDSWNKMVEIAAFFGNQFPHVTRYIKEIKRHNYKRFAQKLQEYESRLVIQTLCARLFELVPGIQLLTVHDSIIAPQQYISIIKREMERTFALQTNVSPKILITGYRINEL